MREFPFVLAGSPAVPLARSTSPVPFDSSGVGRTWLAGDREFDLAADAAVGPASKMRELAAFERADI